MAAQKKRHCRWIIPGALILVIAAAVTYFGISNGRVMDETVESGLNVLRQYYTVTEDEDSEYQELKLYGIMKFDIDRYDVEGLGNLCVMKTNMGVMQMATFVLTPYEKNMPMLSTDFMYILGNRKGYVELYDLVKETSDPGYQAVLSEIQTTLDGYADLEDCEASSGWYDYLLTVDAYKAGKSSQDERFLQLFTDSVDVYAKVSSGLDAMTEEEMAEKLAITQEYCDTMVEKGGVSTSIFKKALGDETTADFFGKVFFGPANYAE